MTVSRILAFPGAYRDSLPLLVGVLKGAVMVMARFRSADRGLVAALRQRAGASGRPLILAVGGIEPRKGSDTLADRLRTAGWKVCARFTWARCAAGHQRIYADLKSR